MNNADIIHLINRMIKCKFDIKPEFMSINFINKGSLIDAIFFSDDTRTFSRFGNR